MPDEPDDPEEPDVPEEPDEPELPDVPDVPEEPDEPDDVPDEPDVPLLLPPPASADASPPVAGLDELDEQAMARRGGRATNAKMDFKRMPLA